MTDADKEAVKLISDIREVAIVTNQEAKDIAMVIISKITSLDIGPTDRKYWLYDVTDAISKI